RAARSRRPDGRRTPPAAAGHGPAGLGPCRGPRAGATGPAGAGRPRPAGRCRDPPASLDSERSPVSPASPRRYRRGERTARATKATPGRVYMDAVFDAQFRIIKDAFAARGIEVAVAYTPAGEVDYVYEAGRLLARSRDVPRIAEVLPPGL